MSTTDSHAKNRGTKMTATEKRDAQIAANRKAQLQWYGVAAAVVIAVVAAIVIISLVTEGELPVYGGHGG